MKIKNKFIFSLLLATMCSNSVWAEIKPDGIDYVLKDNGDGTFAAEVLVRDEVNCSKAGGMYVNYVAEVVDQTKIKDVHITMTGGNISYILAAGNFRAQPVMGNIVFDVTGGTINTLVGANHLNTALTNHYKTEGNIDTITINVGGDANISTIYGASTVSPDEGWPNEDFVKKFSTSGDVTISVKDSADVGGIYGTATRYTAVNGSVTINIDGGNIGEVSLGNGSISGDAIVNLRNGNVTGSITAGNTENKGDTYLFIGTEDKSYTGTVGNIAGFKHVVIAKGSSLALSSGSIFSAKSIHFSLSSININEPVITGASADVEQPITLNITAEGKLSSGKYMLADVTTNSTAATTSAEPEGWNAENVTVNGIADFDDLTWEGSVLYLIYQGVNVDAAIVSNWGVFKSSQAFTGTLWGTRSNAVVLDAPAPVTISDDGKSSVSVADAPAPGAKNLAWGTVYGQSGRISGTGADYSLYGAAIGAERQFGATGSSIGVAFGYDWGKVNPFTTSSVNQDTWHAALYGRVGAWKAGKGIVSVDWSAAYGDTTSEHDDIAGDWSQGSWQLDLRATYARALSERATASVFAGVQYYTQDDAMVDGLHISSLQNLRLTAGAGLSYAATARTNVYGQASVYFDAMRHNPHVDTNGACFKGTNPGRIGGVFSVGADYAITDRWTLRGAYSFDVAKNSTEHNVNAGVQYSF